jgi:uncharacterized protein (DUF169 family)
MPPSEPDDAKPPHAEIAQRFTELLRMTSPPVAVLFTATPPADVPKANENLKSCMFLDTARYAGRVFWTDAGNHGSCRGGRHYVGLGEMPEVLRSGQIPSGDYPAQGVAVFGNPGAFHATFPDYAVMPEGRVSVIAYGPLGLVPWSGDEGDGVVLFFLTAAAGMVMARAAMYETGGAIQGPLGPPTCSMAMVRPALTGQPTYTLGCFGFREFVGIRTDEVLFGLPMAKLGETLANLERLFSRRPDYAAMLEAPPGAERTPAENHTIYDRVAPQPR